MKQGTPRPNNGAKAKHGKFAVPPEIRELRPKNIACTVKVSTNGGYYVCERLRIPDPNNPGKFKNASGKTIGNIIDGKYVPIESQISDIMDEDPDHLDYGAYAIAIACSKDVIPRLKRFYSAKDSLRIYVIAILYFVNHYLPARDLHEIFIQSILCKLYPQVTISENTASEFIHALGSHHKKRKQFEQSLIDEGSGCYNIDGHVILCTSQNNELADYGAKYQKIGDTQANFMMVYDAKNKRAIACHAFDGGLPDNQAVKDVFTSHTFLKARFRVDSGFYSESNIGLYRMNECKFVVPVPSTTILRKTAMKDLSFEGSFVHKRKDKHGKTVYSAVQYRIHKVKDLEDIAVADAKKAAGIINQERQKNAQPGEKIKTAYPQSIRRSKYPEDLVIVYKDQLMHDKLVYDYKCSIGDGKHTEEALEKLEPFFGVIPLRTNDSETTAEALYVEYKDRWLIETYYNYVKNVAGFKAFHEEDYYVQEGIGFLMVIESLIYEGVSKLIREAPESYIHNMSVDECVRIAGRLKVAMHSDNTWHSNTIKGKITSLFEYMNVDVKKDLEKLNIADKSRKTRS